MTKKKLEQGRKRGINRPEVIEGYPVKRVTFVFLTVDCVQRRGGQAVLARNAIVF
jgi:hypothetical protein